MSDDLFIAGGLSFLISFFPAIAIMATDNVLVKSAAIGFYWLAIMAILGAYIDEKRKVAK